MFNKILNNPNYVLYVIPFTIGLLTVFSFQPFNFTLINFFVLPTLFLLIVYVNKKTKNTYREKPYYKNFFLIGFVFSFAFYLSGTFWISYSLTFDENFKFLIPFSILFIPLFLSLFTGLTTLIIGKYLEYNFTSILLFSASLSFSDFVRGKILSGFPWNLWAYSWSWTNEILQLLNLLGLFAFNIIVITIFTIPAVLFLNLSFIKKFLVIVITAVLVFTNYIYGTFAVNKNKAFINNINKSKRVNIKVVSPNFTIKYDQTNQEIENKLKNLIRYSDPNPERNTIFIWPEGVFTGYSYGEVLKFSKLIKKNFSKNHKIIFGINTIEKKTNKYFNSLILVNNDFEILQKYNKKKLVPFGEFLPMENLLNKFGFKKITEGHGSFSAGNNDNIIKIENIISIPLICYEIIFPELIQKSTEDSNLIINISEDGWFGNSIGPHQHFSKAIFRSIENNTFLVRSANQGISAIIDNKGEILKKLETHETGSIEMNIPLIKSDYKNKNDLIFLILLITYLAIFLIFKKNAKK